MKIQLSDKPLDDFKGGCKVRFLSVEDVKKIASSLSSDDHSALAHSVREKLFTGEKNKILPLYGNAKNESLLLVSLDDAAKINISALMSKTGSVWNEAKKIRQKHIIFELPGFSNLKEALVLRAVLDGLLSSDYEFSKKSKSAKPDDKILPSLVTICALKEKHTSLVDECLKISEAVNYTRDLVNENANVIHTLGLAGEALKTAKKYKLKATVLDEKQLSKLGMGLISAVGRGAEHPPRIVILEYKNGGKNKKTLALVGKGITFDTGGLNLKPSGFMEDMRHDMAGAGAVLGAMKAIASLKLKVNVIGVMAIAENAIGSKAYKPGDIFTAYNGKTVEILNTDAEGRLVLADALSYTEKNYKPDVMVDIATLTGAVVIALGSQYAGLMTQDSKLKSTLISSSEETNELLWPMPLTEPYMEEMKSDIADLKNIGEGRNAGTIRGAVFLSSFVDKTPWAHLDIAGISWNHKKQGYQPKYASGFGVRLFVNLCQKI